ncbi:MAG: hypothetical protein JWP97_592 [Labilithrix sp.]|nr:hypothetical protein [Labilithrix sp.]
MRTGTFLAGWGAAALTVALATGPAAAEDAGAPALPACVRVEAQARYVPYGYNHVVIVTNGCTKDASCTVSTDVNPQPQLAEVPRGKTAELVTFSASPSQAFVPKVTCKLR